MSWKDTIICEAVSFLILFYILFYNIEYRAYSPVVKTSLLQEETHGVFSRNSEDPQFDPGWAQSSIFLIYGDNMAAASKKFLVKDKIINEVIQSCDSHVTKYQGARTFGRQLGNVRRTEHCAPKPPSDFDCPKLSNLGMECAKWVLNN